MKKMLVYTESLFVYISKEQKNKLKEFASKKLISMNDIVRDAINEYLQNHPIKDNEQNKDQGNQQNKEQDKGQNN